LTTKKGLQDCHTGTNTGTTLTKNFNGKVCLLWAGAFIAFVIVGSIYAERAANAERINQYFDDPDSPIDTLPYNTCKIPRFSLPSDPEPESFYWK